jgi:hypothetical protein
MIRFGKRLRVKNGAPGGHENRETVSPQASFRPCES